MTTDSTNALIAALRAIVLETMDFSPVRPRSSDSYLPAGLIEAAQVALQMATGERVRDRRAAP